MIGLGKRETAEPRFVTTERRVHATFSSRALWPFVAASRNIGTNVQTSLARVQLNEGQLRDPDVRIPYPIAYNLIKTLVSDSKRGDLGLLAASAVQSGYFDLLELAVRSAPTLGGAIENLIRFSALIDDGSVLTLVRGPELSEMRLVVTCDLSMHPAFVEFIPSMLLLAARRETNIDSLGGECIFFQHAAMASVELYEALFLSPVCFDATETVAIFRSEMLDLPFRRSNPPLEQEAIAVIHEYVSKRND